MTPSDGASIASKTLLGLTYGGLRKQVQAVAEALAASGVNRGDRVGIALANGLPNIVTFLAAPLNPAYEEDVPLFHVHGLVASTLAPLSTGGTVVVPTEFSPLSFWQTAKEHGATWYSAVPTIHQLLLAGVTKDAPRPAGAEKLRFIRSCGASLPPQVMHDLEAAFGAPVLEAYDMTEAAHASWTAQATISRQESEARSMPRHSSMAGFAPAIRVCSTRTAT